MSVDLSLAKAHLRVTSAVEDVLISHYLRAAQGWVENYTGKKLARVEVSERLAGFCGAIRLAWGPNPESASITYTGIDGTPASIANARIEGTRLLPPRGEAWPAIEPGSVIEVTYVAGFADTPPDLDQAVLRLISDYFDNRMAGSATADTTEAVSQLCNPYWTVLV